MNTELNIKINETAMELYKLLRVAAYEVGMQTYTIDGEIAVIDRVVERLTTLLENNNGNS